MINVDVAALTKHVEVLEGTAYLKQDDTIREFAIVEQPSKLCKLDGRSKYCKNPLPT